MVNSWYRVYNRFSLKLRKDFINISIEDETTPTIPYGKKRGVTIGNLCRTNFLSILFQSSLSLNAQYYQWNLLFFFFFFLSPTVFLLRLNTAPLRKPIILCHWTTLIALILVHRFEIFGPFEMFEIITKIFIPICSLIVHSNA